MARILKTCNVVDGQKQAESFLMLKFDEKGMLCQTVVRVAIGVADDPSLQVNYQQFGITPTDTVKANAQALIDSLFADMKKVAGVSGA